MAINTGPTQGGNSINLRPNDSNGSSFIIKETTQGSQQTRGSFKTKPLTAPIEWTLASYAKPRETFKIKKKLRTLRTDYSDKPTEQVLGIMYEPFTLSGVWDNKYNGGPDLDFAWNMKETFEALQDRANLCEFSFDDIHLTGLITEFNIEYFRRSYIGYSFTVSPHFREKNSNTRVAPRLATSASTFDYALAAVIAATIIRHSAGPGPYMVVGPTQIITNYIGKVQQSGRSSYDQVTQYINAWSIGSSNITSIIENRLSSGPLNKSSGVGLNSKNNVITGVQRLLQELATMDSNSIQMIEFLKSATASTGLTYQDGTQVIAYQAWAGALKLYARQMLEISFNAQQELKKLVDNDIITIYRPSYLESLYEIAQKFYGDTDMWRIIYSQNALQQLVLQGDELLIIPKVSD